MFQKNLSINRLTSPSDQSGFLHSSRLGNWLTYLLQGLGDLYECL